MRYSAELHRGERDISTFLDIRYLGLLLETMDSFHVASYGRTKVQEGKTLPAACAKEQTTAITAETTEEAAKVEDFERHIDIEIE